MGPERGLSYIHPRENNNPNIVLTHIMEDSINNTENPAWEALPELRAAGGGPAKAGFQFVEDS